MEYSSTKKQRLPGISFMMDDNDNSSDDEETDSISSNNNNNMLATGNDATMMSMMSSNTTTTNYYHNCDPVESPLVTHTEETDEMNNNNQRSPPSDATMESPIMTMTSLPLHSSAATTIAQQTTPAPTASTTTAIPSPFFSPTTNALNHSLIQHAESLVGNTHSTPLERVENGVWNVMERFTSGFSSVKKRTLLENSSYGLQYNEEEGGGEGERGEETIVLDVAAAYMARLTRDGLYDEIDDSQEDQQQVDNDGNEGIDNGHSSPMYDDRERIGINEDEEHDDLIGGEDITAAVLHSPVVEDVNDGGIGDSIQEDESKSHEDDDESSNNTLLATFDDSCYHEDSNNIEDEEEQNDDDLDSYYICNTAGFCSSESVNGSSISETASEDDLEEEDDDEFYQEEDDDVDDDETTNKDDKSCSLDLTGIEQIMNLDDTLPSVIPPPNNMQLCQSNSDVDLSGIDDVMNLDTTLPLEEQCDEGTGVDETGNIIDGDVLVQAEPSFDNSDSIAPSTNGVDSSLDDDNKEGDDEIVTSNRDIIQEDEPSPLQDNDEGDDDDFVPSALKEMISQQFSQQESEISSLLGSITNMQSTPGRIKKMEASLLGEEDEDTGLNGIVDMTNAEVGLTPVKRRLELVVEEEVETGSARKARMKQSDASVKSGLEPDLSESELQGSGTSSTSPHSNLPDFKADNGDTSCHPSMELEVGEEKEAVASPQTTASPGIATNSPEAPNKSPWISFISRQSPPSQPQEEAPTPPDVHEEEAEEQTVQELPSNFTSSEDPVSEPTQESEKIDTSVDPMPTDTSKSVAENDVPDSILQMFADADNALQNALESSMLIDTNASPDLKEASESVDSDVDSLELNEVAIDTNASPDLKEASESVDSDVDSLELNEVAESANSVHEPTSTEPIKCDEVEFNEAELMSESVPEEKQHSASSATIDISEGEVDVNEPKLMTDSLSEENQIAGIQTSIDSHEKKEPEPLVHSASSEAIGSVVKMTSEDFQVAEPSITGEEPTLECLRGAFLAAESKLEAESKIPASLLPESRDSDEEEEHTDSVPSDNKSDSSSAVNDTFETANFSLGDIEKAANEHFFFDAEDNMKDVDGNSCVHTASENNSGTAASKEDDKALPSDGLNPSENSFAEEDFVESSGDGNHVDKLDESTETVATASALGNDQGDENQADAVVTESSPIDSHNTKLSPSASDESVLNESMFMPNASPMEAESPPLIEEESLPPVAADTLRTSPEEEYESEDGDDDEDFFPNRDLRSSSNAPKESMQAETNSSEANSHHGSISSRKNGVKNVIMGTEKESSSRLPKLPSRTKFGSKSSASSKHRDRQSSSEPSVKPPVSSKIKPAITSSKDELKDSNVQKRHPRVRIRARKSAIPADGKENNTVERSSKGNSSKASKKSSYSVERLERLSKPRRQSMIPKPSPVKQQGSNKVASIDRLSRLAQPRRQSVVPTNSPNNSPAQKRAPRKASGDRLSQLAQPRRQSVAPNLSPVKQKEEQKVAAGTPSFVRRSKLMSSSKPTIKSTEEMEQEEMSHFKPFKAKKLNGREVQSRFKAPVRKPPRINTAQPVPETKTRPPAAVKAPSSRLYQPSPRRQKVLTFGESQQSYLNNGLRSQPPLPHVSTKLTTPKPFALSTRTNIPKAPPASNDEIELKKKFKAKPYPFPRRNTMSFSQAKSSEELELEECRKQFRALPLPASVSTSKINYSSTPTPYHVKAQQQYEMAMERKQRIADESQETMSFKARPVPRSTYEARKVTRQSISNSNTRKIVPRPPRLSLASRAEERKLFDEHARELREKDAQEKENILRQQKEWEEEELKQKRMTSAEEGGMCFKAREIHIEYM